MHLRGLDMNLLLPLQALLEERNVTRAAQRIHMSQPAMSRALERLRGVLGDDLLIRANAKYELTPRGAHLLRELELLLPRLEQLWSGEQFTPGSTQARVRLAMTDYAAAVVLPPLLRACEQAAPGLNLDVTPWHERSHEELSAATVDLVFSPLAVPAHLRVQPLFDEQFVCLVGLESNLRHAEFPLASYLEEKHVSVETEPKQQNLIDRPLAEAGWRRSIVLRLPYVSAAVRVIEDTGLVLTAPSRIAAAFAERFRVRRIAAPPQIPGFRYTMVWHPRLEQESLHAWFRGLVARICADHVAKPGPLIP